MRYVLLVCALCFITTNIYAQDDSGEPLPGKTIQERSLLPKKGDFSIGIDAVPFAEYLGNIFNGTQNNSVGADFIGNRQQIFGKYFLDDDMAIRGRLRLKQDITTNRNRVIQDNQTIPDPNVEVTDEWTDYETFVRLGGGVEFRRGNGRLIGVYGGEASILYGTQSTDVEYGNTMSLSNQTPSSTGQFTRIIDGRFERLTDSKSNKQLGFGINGFVGVEYFIATKISVGAEFTVGMDFIKNYRNERTYQFWDTNLNSLENRRYISEGGQRLSVFTGNYSGSINLMFYF